MFVLFFLLWILMAGELSMHTCLWGLAASALMTWFCRKVLDYRWKLGRKSIGSVWAFCGISAIWWRRCSKRALW